MCKRSTCFKPALPAPGVRPSRSRRSHRDDLLFRCLQKVKQMLWCASHRLGWQQNWGRCSFLAVHLDFCVHGLLLCSWYFLYESISGLELSKKEGKYFMLISSAYAIKVWPMLPGQSSLLKYYSSPVCTVVGWTVSKARDILQDRMSTYCLQRVVLAWDDLCLQVSKCVFLSAHCLMTESSRMVPVPW